MKETVIFAGSYPQISSTLCLAETYINNNPVTIVIPYNHDLFRFFNEINERVFSSTINLVFIERYKAKRVGAEGIVKVVSVIRDILGERNHLRNIYQKEFARLSGVEVYFSSRCYCPYTYYMLKRLSPKNTLVHIADPSMDGRYLERWIPRNITQLASIGIAKAIFGLDISKKRIQNNVIVCMPDGFYTREIDRIITPEERDRLLSDFDIEKYRIFEKGKFKVIFFDDGLIEAGFVDAEIYKKELAGIFNVILRYFKEEEVACKYHPGYPGDRMLIEIGNVLPDYIPAELLYNDYVNIYLSIFSLSIASVKTGKVVSISNLITIKDGMMKDYLKTILKQRSKSEILFPETMNEFEMILASVTGEKPGVSDISP